MTWDIIFFKNARQEEIVKTFIRNLQEPTIAKVAHHIDILRQKGPYIPMPYSKKVSGKIYELRVRGKQEIRIFYSFVENHIHILHAFQKKSQKTPVKEIKTAEERLKSLTAR